MLNAHKPMAAPSLRGQPQRTGAAQTAPTKIGIAERTAPAVYRPNNALPNASTAQLFSNNPPAAPGIYSPQPVRRVLQTKASVPEALHPSPVTRQSLAPPVYRPQPAPLAQTKAIAQQRTSPLVDPGMKTPPHPTRQTKSIHPSSVWPRSHGGPVLQTKGGRKEGTFIGDPAAIHLHIDIGNPHLKVAGHRIDIRGPGGYSKARCAEALNLLTSEDRRHVSGATECREWLENELDGQTIPYNLRGLAEGISGSSWGSGLIMIYPSRPFRKGQ
ncbi:MAG TPA: hypothetical protein VNW97_12370 [Candidatus Saccharimonadales bacterium]|nr:hypothetical protein [Candidatus Saccharimonadales bacterium]